MDTLSTTRDDVVNAPDVLTSKNGFRYELIAQSNDIIVQNRDNFPQGCSFSPDGLCILTATVGDSKLRLYNTPTSLLTRNIGNKDTKDDDVDDGSNIIDQPVHDDTTIVPDSIKQNDNNQKQNVPIEVQKWTTALSSGGGDSIRSYAWYPFMTSSEHTTCCFAAVARDQPIHLYDAYTGGIRASYSPYNALDEMESPMVVTFSPDGQKIIGCGFRTDRTIFSFDTSRPGRDAVAIFKLGKTRRSSDGQKGLISSIGFQQPNFSPCGNRIFAVGTYSPGSIYVYDDRIIAATQQPTGTILTGACIVGHGKGNHRKKRRFLSLIESEKSSKANHDIDDEKDDWINAAKSAWCQNKTRGGVNQLQFAPTNEYYLYSASRRANTVLAWDLRMLSGIDDYQTKPITVFKSYETYNDTNQRIEFDFNRETGNTLYVGGQDNCVRVYDTTTGTLQGRIEGFDSAVNGVSFFRGFVPNRPLLATATGSRYFPPIRDNDDLDLVQDEDSTEIAHIRPEGILSLFELTNE